MFRRYRTRPKMMKNPFSRDTFILLSRTTYATYSTTILWRSLYQNSHSSPRHLHTHNRVPNSLNLLEQLEYITGTLKYYMYLLLYWVLNWSFHLMYFMPHSPNLKKKLPCPNFYSMWPLAYKSMRILAYISQEILLVNNFNQLQT